MKIVQIQNSFCLLEFKYIFFLASTSSTISIIAVKLLNAIMHTLHVTKKTKIKLEYTMELVFAIFF